MTIEEAIQQIEDAMHRAGEVMRENRKQGQPADYDAGREAGLQEALEILGKLG